MKYYIKTFGCQQNEADSERIATCLQARGMKPAKTIEQADHIVVNTCMVRESAENRVYGLVNNLARAKGKESRVKIVVTGCMVGMAIRDKTGKLMRKIRKAMPLVDEYLPIEEAGFDHAPLRKNKTHAWVTISYGCNNFCTYCVVPFARGRELSRPFDEIIDETRQLVRGGYTSITLLGQNVNSYGADLVRSGQFTVDSKKKIRPVYVRHMGKYRVPTLFPYLLEEVCKVQGVKNVNFLSSNPWDFSDELIKVIKKNKKITRLIHLPLQSGDNQVLKRMNRHYTRDEYLQLVTNLKFQIKNLKLSTDIIVGFPGETKKQFQNTVNLCKKAGFVKAYISKYSDRPMTVAHKTFSDNVPYPEKKRRWQILDKLINSKHYK